ncbi:DNA-binding helix-turn-helix protein [Leptospira broomii serovar Hurstbridge str. 5399]|uniref:DNA-binding helix-turn-helix protein n=1 Tax=Leptospira broomii serovar Hurstbridge str. 5399 TaxID=1049789 RepID=T0FFC9_9LEPT|nr:AraC family transcriptional regulator [Leptospira broomii]EQA46327.1 DNA-binding helix-turn-helix protein [Leptospira broomii serovar Hurstbridge str. 5399]
MKADRSSISTIRLTDIYRDSNIPFLQVNRLQNLPSDFVEYYSGHRHDYFAVFFFLKGMGNHRIDFVDYKIEDNSLFFIRPGQVHSWRFDSPVIGYALKFSPEFFTRNSAVRSAIFSFPFFKSGTSRSKIQFRESGTLARDFDRLLMERENGSDEGILFALTQLILLEIKREYEFGWEASDATFELISEFEQILEQNFIRERSTLFYARRLGVSASALNSACKNRLGINAKSVINERIILEIKRLLVHSVNSISEISREVNFSDNAYLSRFFRAQAGVSPERYREENRKVQ